MYGPGPSSVPRVLVVKLSSLGDLFHALPAVHGLKVGLKAEIDWVAHAQYVELVRCFTDVARVIPFPRHSFWSQASAFFRELRATEYDYVVDLQGLLKSALVTRLARGRRRVGPSFHREGTRLLYPEIAGPRNRERHAVEQNLDVVNHLGLERLPQVFPVVFPQAKLTAPQPRIALVPFSRWPSKNWPVEHFIELGRGLRSKAQATLFLVAGPADARVCSEMSAAIGPGVENMAGKLTLVETGSLLREMDLVVSNDSGPVHMAVAVETPTLVLFGPTDPARTGPYPMAPPAARGERHRVIRSHAPCQPCFLRDCKLKGTGTVCLAQIPPATVTQAAMEMLGEICDLRG